VLPDRAVPVTGCSVVLTCMRRRRQASHERKSCGADPAFTVISAPNEYCRHQPTLDW